ncbi:MAG: DUF4190 domain-containing protein [Bacteroidales bacterium]|nr:DUF4190 domain-containing protein [Bacteroidales bacterium]
MEENYTQEMNVDYQQFNGYPRRLENAPYAISSMIMGIVSLAISSGILVGLIFAIIGLVQSKKGMRIFNEDPYRYKGYSMLRAGRTCSIVGVVLNILTTALWILYFFFLFDHMYLFE